MKLIDALLQVKKPEPSHEWDFMPPVEVVAEELGLNAFWDWPDNLTKRLVAYPVFKWLCTDEMVGLDALYFDGNPVAAIKRCCRKCAYQITWVSEAAAARVRTYLISISKNESITLLDFEEEIDFKELGYHSGRAVVLEVDQ